MPKGDKNKSYVSLLFASSIWLLIVFNICEADTSAGRFKVHFAVTSHIFLTATYNIAQVDEKLE